MHKSKYNLVHSLAITFLVVRATNQLIRGIGANLGEA